MTPIGISKRTRAWSQRDVFVSPADCICAEGNTLPPFGYFGRRQDSEQKLANDLQFAAKITDAKPRAAAAIVNDR